MQTCVLVCSKTKHVKVLKLIGAKELTSGLHTVPRIRVVRASVGDRYTQRIELVDWG
jgi:hypothetical protein